MRNKAIAVVVLLLAGCVGRQRVVKRAPFENPLQGQLAIRTAAGETALLISPDGRTWTWTGSAEDVVTALLAVLNKQMQLSEQKISELERDRAATAPAITKSTTPAHEHLTTRADEAYKLPRPCPCDGQKDCKCDYASGVYSWSDGCNTTTCDAVSRCSSTLMYCQPPDWRTKYPEVK